MKIWIKKNKVSIILSVVFLLIFWGFNSFERKSESYYSYIFLYFSINILSNLLPNRPIIKQIKILISIPGFVLLMIGPLIESILFLIFAFIVPFSILALFYKFIPVYVFGLDLNYGTNLYLLLVSFTVLSTLFSEKLMHRINSILNYDKSEERKKNLIELALALANTERIRFLIYTSFFCYLLIFSISKLSAIELFENSDISMSIFYSFITYIAFERIIFNLELMKISPKSFISKLLKTWENDE